MLHCNLAVLLAERGLKITKVSNDTGISRTTLTALCSNRGLGIQFETLNTLCLYLGVGPEKLINFVPINIKVSGIELDKKSETCVVTLEIMENGRTITCSLPGMTIPDYELGKLHGMGVQLEFWDEVANSDDPDIINENATLLRVLKKLPLGFLKDLEGDILDGVLSKYEDSGDVLDEEGVLSDLYWPYEIRNN